MLLASSELWILDIGVGRSKILKFGEEKLDSRGGFEK
jgi:hypothetical protein